MNKTQPAPRRTTAPFEWSAVVLIVAATALFSTSNLLWTVREGVTPLSANSEFFAYSWVYGVRWGHGERHIFQPHSQLLFTIYALIDWAFSMTSGGTDRIVDGWRRISLIWPIVLTVASFGLLFGTVNRQAPIPDAILSAVIYLVAVPLFLTEHALNSLSYHSLAIVLALAALPLWRHYLTPVRPPSHFYFWLGVYAAVCAFSKPTFLAFSAPFYMMEVCRSIRDRSGTIFLRTLAAAVVALTCYFVWMLLLCRGFEGLTYQLSKTYEFMRSQSGMYADAKGVTPLHWYAGYVIGVMGPLPSVLIVVAAGLVPLCRDRLIITIGVCTGIVCALFCLYVRTQLHGQPEFIGLLMTLVVGILRVAKVPEKIEEHAASFVAPMAGVGAFALTGYTLVSPPEMKLRDFSVFMAKFDKVIVPNLFEQPQSVRTIALQIYPVVFYGVGDAWCRGSTDIFGIQPYSRLLDKAFGNLTCMHNIENPAIDISSYNRVIFPKEADSSIEVALSTMKTNFPDVLKRMTGCRSVEGDIPRFEVVECKLR
ncbi:hypothetical protein [Bradyrhizobium liaoningense]|uniref:hypothetical protein n=1 Tax=Bradyrhizobium liaoningense TaxID=43992 RepID=UPI0024E0CCEA|nr:hypothetical protein [Bradyrhizobium liaoningense]